MTKQQEFLLNNHLHDIIIKDNEDISKRVYLSDVLELYDKNKYTEQLIKCDCKISKPDIMYGTYCNNCGFDLPKTK